MILLMTTGERDVIYGLLLIWGTPKNLRVLRDIRVLCCSSLSGPRDSSFSQAWRWTVLVSLGHMHMWRPEICMGHATCTETLMGNTHTTWEHRTYIDT